MFLTSSNSNIASNAVSRRLAPLFVAIFFQNIVFWYAIEKVFQISIGFTEFSVAVETVVFMLIILILGIPVGVIADRWSRKSLLIIGSIALIVTSLITGLSNSVAIYIFGMAFWGIFYVCYLGIYDSVIYDTLLEENKTSNNIEYYYGKIEVYSSISLVASSLISGIIAEKYGLRANYYLTAVFVSLSLIPLSLFKEPLLHKKTLAVPVKKHLSLTLNAVLNRKTSMYIVSSLILISISLSLIQEFGPLWFVGLSLPTRFFGPVIASLQVVGALSGYAATRIKNNKALILIVGIVLVVTAMTLTAKALPVILFSQLYLIFSLLTLRILVKRKFHDLMTSQIRTSASLTIKTISYVIFIPIALIFGVISIKTSVFDAAWLIIIVIITAIYQIRNIYVKDKNIFN